MQGNETSKLYVKNTPKIPFSALKELFFHYGCINCTPIGSGLSWILEFENQTKTNFAYQSLNQLNILNTTMDVRFYKPKKAEKLEQLEKLEFVNNNSTTNQQLEYVYPEADDYILCNILNALKTFPKFYTQVLHLMNKMNLPPPFKGSIHIPLTVDYEKIKQKLNKKLKSEKDELLSSSESELSDEQDVVRDKSKNNFKKTQLEHLYFPPTKKQKISHSDESPKMVIDQTSKEKQNVLGPITPVDPICTTPTPHEGIPSMDKIALRQRNETSTILSNYSRWTTQQILDKFPNYVQGEPTTKLYIKNIAKKVNQNELEEIVFSILGNECEGTVVDLKTKGRLRGQAFVTLPTAQLATVLLTNIHGLEVQDKPLIVQYARVV